MIEIPEHLLERSRAARARLTGEAAPAPAAAADEEPAVADTAPAAAVEPEPAAVEAEPVAAEPVEVEPVAAEVEEPEPDAEPAPAASSLPVLAGDVLVPAAVLSPLPVDTDRPFVDFAFSSDPDSAARRHLVSASAWLVVGAVVSCIPAIQLVEPGFLGSPMFGFGRIVPVARGLVLYGWLSLAVMGALYFVTPRLCGRRLYAEPLANAGLWLMQAGVAVGAASVLVGESTGREGLEFPLWSAAGIEAGFIATAVCVVGTVLQRDDDGPLPVSVYFAVAAPIFAAFLYPIAHVPGFFDVTRALITVFFAQNVGGLWIGLAAIGAVHYVVPWVTGNPLYSRRLGLITFWSFAFAHLWTGATRLIYGPGPDWVETLAAAFAVSLVMPALSVAVNLAGTMRRRWYMAVEAPAVKFAMAGSGFLVLATMAFALQSLRSFSQAIAFTSVPDGTATLFLLGAYSMFLFAVAYDAVPRMSGRQWLSSSATAVHFWLSAVSVSVTVVALWGGGMAQGLTLVAGATAEPAATVGEGFAAALVVTRPFFVIAAVGSLGFAAAQAVFFGHLAASLAGVRTLRPELAITAEPEPEPEEPEALELVEGEADDETTDDADEGEATESADGEPAEAEEHVA